MSMRTLRAVARLIPAALAVLVRAGGAVADDPTGAAGGANRPAPGRLTTRDDQARAAADDALRSDLRQSADLLGLPGFVAGVVRDGKLSLVQAEGFADLESRTPMRQDHIFHVASLTKTFTSVMMMRYVQEKKISLDDYLLDYPFLSAGFRRRSKIVIPHNRSCFETL